MPDSTHLDGRVARAYRQGHLAVAEHRPASADLGFAGGGLA